MSTTTDPAHEPRLDVSSHAKAAYAAMARVEERIDLDPVLRELVKLRASQLNGCAFCLRMHAADAVAAGETADRLAVLAGWWESQYFSAEEQAALQIAERVTLLSDHGRLADRGVDVDGVLTEKQIAAVTWLTVVINSWNRIAVSTHYPVAP